MNQTDIINAKEFNISETEISTIVDDSLSQFGIVNAFVQLTFVTDDEIAKLNAEYRSIDHATDVLSFPQVEIPQAETRVLGDIVISTSKVEEKGETLEDVVKHGLLHLLGYDHETDQEKWDIAAEKIDCKY